MLEKFINYKDSFLHGEWIEGTSGRSYENTNPYDDALIQTMSIASKQQLEDAYIASKKAQKKWAKSTADTRVNILNKVAEYLKTNKEEIVDVIVHETGGSKIKANVEVDLTVGIVEEATEMANEIFQAEELPAQVEGKKNRLIRLPFGVITSISPFNFPLNLSMRTIAPAIALGNCVVHKPDLQVAYTGGIIIAKAFEDAGLPNDVLNVVQTDLEEIGDDMLTTPHSHLVSFTGSTPVGKHIGEIAGSKLKRVALELGGNNPFLVMSDANVDRAVEAAIFGKFIHQGQICMIINRFIIHKSKYDEFVKKFVEKASEIPCGDPRDDETIIGPLINDTQVEEAQKLISRAKEVGTDVKLEGKQEGRVITPYVFGDVKNDSEIAQTEQFAPIAVMIKAETDDIAIELANDTEFGLSSAIFTEDIERGKNLALEINSGMTHINDQTVNDNPTVPFGGTKESGMGRFGNPWIVDKFTTTKWVSVQEEYREFPF